jgi:protoporphyrinogen oxidase
MWEAFARRITDAGGSICLNSRVVALHHDERAITSIEVESGGRRYFQPVSHVISTMPVRQLVQQLAPAAPGEVVEAAAALKYRDFLTVALVIDQRTSSPTIGSTFTTSACASANSELQELESGHVPDDRYTCLGSSTSVLIPTGCGRRPTPTSSR